VTGGTRNRGPERGRVRAGVRPRGVVGLALPRHPTGWHVRSLKPGSEGRAASDGAWAGAYHVRHWFTPGPSSRPSRRAVSSPSGAAPSIPPRRRRLAPPSQPADRHLAPLSVVERPGHAGGRVAGGRTEGLGPALRASHFQLHLIFSDLLPSSFPPPLLLLLLLLLNRPPAASSPPAPTPTWTRTCCRSPPFSSIPTASS